MNKLFAIIILAFMVSSCTKTETIATPSQTIVTNDSSQFSRKATGSSFRWNQ